MAGTLGHSGGHNRLPAQVHVMRGTFRRDRHGASPAAAPASPAEAPTVRPPRPLAGFARAEWKRLIARKIADRTLHASDAALIYQTACLFGELEDLAADRRRQQQLAGQLRRRVSRLPGSELATVVEQIARLEKLTVRLATQLRAGRQAIRHLYAELGLSPLTRDRASKTLTGLEAARPTSLSRTEAFAAKKGQTA